MTDIVLIPLRNRAGEVIARATIDASDAEWAGQWRWSLNANGYAWRSIEGGRRHVYLHRALGGAQPGDGKYVDHVNRDKLDCRRSNLRIVTPQESAQNKTASRQGPRGVSFDAARGQWVAKGQLGGRTYNLGRFADESAAAAAVQAWRREHMPFSTEEEPR